MNTSKIIKAYIGAGTYSTTEPITQGDYGYILQIEGAELPATYRVDFSNNRHEGEALTVYGNENGAEVPEELIATGKDIFAFYYYIGENFGKTAYTWKIPNDTRAKYGDRTPTPTQQDSIDQLIVRSNEAVERAEQAKDEAETAQGKAEDAQGASERAKQSAEQSATDAHESVSQANASATASAQSASQSAQIKADVEDLADDAQGYANSAQQSASQASASEQGCARAVLDAASAAAIARARAEEANGYAQTASAKAQDASQSASTASQKATESAQSASQALSYKTDAESAKTAAETARAGSESARDEAVAANTSAQQSESAMRDMLEEYSDVATEATAQEILRREEDGLALMEFALRALDNRLDTMVEDLPHDTTGQQLAEALNFGNSMLNALYNELANEEV